MGHHNIFLVYKIKDKPDAGFALLLVYAYLKWYWVLSSILMFQSI